MRIPVTAKLSELTRTYLVRTLMPDVLERHFRPGQEVTGKILLSLPREQLFVLHARGLNLVAKSHLSLFEGDRIRGKVVSNRGQIHLKLTEVNGKPVSQSVVLDQASIDYIRLALPAEYWGPGSYLEIYPDRENGKADGDRPERKSLRMILQSVSLRSLAMEFLLQGRFLAGSVWVEDAGLLQFLRAHRERISESLQAEDLVVEVQFLPMNCEIGHFRERWVGVVEIDMRA